MSYARRAGFPAFAPAFRRNRRLKVAPYLHLLNLVAPVHPAVTVVSRCAKKAERHPDQVEALLRGDDGWRSQLVGCVAVLASIEPQRAMSALADAALRPSWISPQLLATLSLLGEPGWERSVGAGVLERGDSKAAGALVALAAGVPTRITELASLDWDSGGAIAGDWREGIGVAFDDAGVSRSW